jgi:hypothetical protein
MKIVMARARSRFFRHPGLLVTGIALLAFVAPMPHARADVCSGKYAISADLITVTDNDTHLVWQREVETLGGMPCSDSSGNGCYAWQEANAYCAGLPLSGGGWRLPHVFELQTLVDESQNGPGSSLNQMAFPGTPVSAYWSSTTASIPGYAWYDAVGNSSVIAVSQVFRVRCVR